ncbi:sarcoplasmic reticulum histidine-rich calcium-binding protein-like [Papaver somniferum]|uniref:sarcoplasmic reticulum histidine-rich calcium-binding protein-like n=1 Tax=Papaver somniferum TaxID=3469 RepID=UPI000E6FF000|nr:sarcoplasmic reticulum histidine-rich calcium-binding protein-like [Papaver somniferum]
MASSSDPIPVVPAISDEYKLSKDHAFLLGLEELMKLMDEVQGEITGRAGEAAQRQREEEEIKRREDEEIESLFAAWKPKHFARVDRKEEERSLKRQKGPKYNSATESDSKEGSDSGFECPVEEVNTNEEDSDVVQDKKRMGRYLDWKLRRRFDHERVNPKIFVRTMREGEPSDDERVPSRIFPRTMHVQESSDDDEELRDAARSENDDEEDSDEESISSDGDTSPASSGSSYSAQYDEDEDSSYDGEDF